MKQVLLAKKQQQKGFYMKKIIFLDIDGTIRNFDGTIPESTIRAVRKAREKGHEVCICSGRPYNQIEKKVLDIGFDGVVSSAGGNTQYKGECIGKTCFSPEVYKGFCGYLLEHDCVVEIQRSDKTFVPAQCYEEYLNVGRRLMELTGSTQKILKEFPEKAENAAELPDVEKMLFFSNELPYETIAKDWEGKIHMTTFSLPNPEKWGGEITPPDVMKTAGIRRILEAGGFSGEDVIAIGDSDNDIDMLEFASVGVCMGNGTPNAKKAADMLTDSVMEDGIEKAFLRLGLID